jgi:hypothetical protein
MCSVVPKRISLSIFFFGCAVLLSCSDVHVQQVCNAEVKILLLPTDSKTAAATLGARRESSGRIYFFDSDDLDLLSQGTIVRLRQGPRRDLTVRLRPPSGKKSAIHSEGSECEVDLTPRGSVQIDRVGSGSVVFGTFRAIAIRPPAATLLACQRATRMRGH